MYVRLVDTDRLAVSDVESLRLYDVSATPALITQVDEPGALPFFDQNPAGERLTSNETVIARSRTPRTNDRHWASTPTVVDLYLASDLSHIATVKPGLRLDHETLDLSPDGKWLASTHRGAGLVVFDCDTAQIVLELDGEIASGACFSPDQCWVAVGETGQAGGLLTLVNIADTESPEKVVLPPPEASFPLYDSPFCSCFSHDGNKVAFSGCAWGRAGVVVYDVESKEEVWSSKFDTTDDEEAEFWSAPEIALAVDDSLLLVGQCGEIRAFRMTDGQELETLTRDRSAGQWLTADSKRGGVWQATEDGPSLLSFPDSWV